MNTSYLLMIVTIISKVFGLAREKALAHFFGAGMVADVFLIAFQIPMTFTNIVSGAVANGYIPMFNNIKVRESKEEAHKFTANISNILGILTIVLSLGGIIFAKPLVKLMADGFTGETLETAVFVSRVAMTSLFATAIASIFKAYLQIEGKFIISVSHAIIMNLIIILSMMIGKKMGISYLAIGIGMAFILQYLIFIPDIRKDYRHRWIVNFKDPHVKRLIHLILPILISTSAIELNFMVSRSLASNLYEGAISTLNYAYKLQAFVTGIVVTSIITATYPNMAKYGSVKDYRELGKSAGEAISTMALLVIPASLGLLIFSEPIVRLLFVGGAFSKQDGHMTAVVLSYYALGILGIGVREIISRIYYSVEDTRTPVINSVLIVGLNIILSFILSKIMGIRGLAFATTISFIIGALALLFHTKKIVPVVIDMKKGMNLLKITFASIIMGLGSKGVFQLIEGRWGSNLSLIISILVAGMIYALAILILQVEEVHKIFKRK